MAAYAFLRIDKELLRGFGMVPSAFMLVRLAMYTGASGSVFEPGREALLYCAIVLSSLGGMAAGSWARRWLPSAAVHSAILWLVVLASALMLRALERPAVAAAYALLCVAAAALSCARRHGGGSGSGGGGA